MKITYLKILLFSTVSLLLCCNSTTPFPDDEEKGKTDLDLLEDWREGYLDIHQISTGRGNCTFMILPDGTTFVVDVGDLGVGNDIIMKPVPNDSKRPAEWIARYIKHFSEPLNNNGAIDFLHLTHFHNDHIGTDDALAIDGYKDYKLTGVTHLAQLLDIGTLIDRGYPEYNYPTRAFLEEQNSRTFPNYYKYVQERASENKKIEKFEAGSNTQIRLLNSPAKYDFEVRNIICNGKIWTGNANGVADLFPSIDQLDRSQYPNENRCSSVFTLRYGKFDYFSGGDMLGVANNPLWYDMETPVSNLVGPMDVVLCNHHAYSDAMNGAFIAATRPQAFIIPVWDYYHPQPETLARMLDRSLYEGERMVFAAGMVENNRIRLGEDGQQIKPDGHIVVRVYEGGDEFQIFVLNNMSEDYEIIYQTDKLTSN